jgi:hypothetical protein
MFPGMRSTFWKPKFRRRESARPRARSSGVGAAAFGSTIGSGSCR